MKIKNLIIASKDSIFDQAFSERTIVAEFKSEEEEEKYAMKDNDLIEEMEKVQMELFQIEKNAYDPCLNWDWWPNHTRYVEVSLDKYTQEYLDALQALLKGKYKKWRIQMIVYGDHMDGKSMIGSLSIDHDTVLIDRALYGFSVWRGIQLGNRKKAVWLEEEE